MKFCRWIRFVSAAIAVFLTGCAAVPSSVSLDGSNVKLLHKAYIEPNVQKPDTVLFLNGSPGTASMPLATVLTTDNSPLSKLSIKDLLEKENIDIGDIVYAEAQKLISQKKFIGLTSETSADVVFKFVVNGYGFGKTHPFGSVYDATIRITASLVTRDGKLIWQESNFVSGLALDNNKGQTLDVYYSNPETLRVALATCARIALERILAKIPDKLPS